jgi:hypothetical protein
MKMMAYLWMAVEHGYNALISGGTASGKTSTLNALALFVPRESKIVSIEETREINLPHPNWIPGVTRSGFGEVVNDRLVGEIDLFDMMKAALRQRPEYILVGEIRGQEAYVLFQAMATGHTTYSTVHADTTQALIHRLEGKPINIPRTMLQSLDIILLMRTQKTQNQQLRRCIKIVELLSVDSETSEVLTNTVFEYNPAEDEFQYSGKSFVLDQIHSHMDMSVDEITEEVQNRAQILDWLRTYHIREFTDVAQILAKYAEKPEDVLEFVGKPPEKIDEEVKESLLSEIKEYNSILDLQKDQPELTNEKKKSKKEPITKIKSIFNKEDKTFKQKREPTSKKPTKVEKKEKKSKHEKKKIPSLLSKSKKSPTKSKKETKKKDDITSKKHWKRAKKNEKKSPSTLKKISKIRIKVSKNKNKNKQKSSPSGEN